MTDEDPATPDDPADSDDTAAWSPDELAGVVDLFGGLTREELTRALRELAFKRGDDPSTERVDDAIEQATTAYALVEYQRESDDDTLLAAGPTAFPTLPADAEDLPHIMAVSPRNVDRERLGEQVGERMLADAARAAADDDQDRIRWLLDVSYDLETWAPVDLSSVRDRFDSLLDD